MVHCVYFPPTLPTDQVLSSLSSLPRRSDTIICGDFNARLGDLTGDSRTNPRGNALSGWLQDNNLFLLNASLAHGIDTYCTFRRGEVASSIIDLFITNMDPADLTTPHITVASDLSLGSDHRLLTLQFTSSPRPSAEPLDPRGLSQRRLWNLSRLSEEEPLTLLRHRLTTSIQPLADHLEFITEHPPPVRPPINQLSCSGPR